MTNAGGTAAGGGTEFQARAAAYWLAKMTAESPLSDSLEIRGRVVAVRCESDLPVDDILVEVEDELCVDGYLSCQAKRTLSVSTLATSEFAKVGDQIARQYIANKTNGAAANGWDRPLRFERDAMLIVTTAESPRSLTVHLPRALKCIRGLKAGVPYMQGATNDDETGVLTALVTVIQGGATAKRGTAFTDDELREVLSLVRVHVIDVDEDGAHVTSAISDLSENAVDVQEARQRWAALVEIALSMIADRDRNDRARLARRLPFLAIPRDRRDALTRLRKLSADTLVRLSRLTFLPRRDEAPLHLKRAVIDAVAAEAARGHLAVVGRPGAGKSGALAAWAERERATSDVVCVAVDSVIDASFWSELAETLSYWSGKKNAYLVVDALDAARGVDGEAAMRTALERIAADGRWHVVASVRSFDLINSPQLRDLFRGQPHAAFRSDALELLRVHHVSVPELSNGELEDVKKQHADLREVLAHAPDDLSTLLRSPFNLWLLADLLVSGVGATELSGIATSVELLDRWWERRVGLPPTERIGRETYLRRLLAGMFASRALGASVDTDGAADYLHPLLSSHVLERPQSQLVSFAHHVIFDFAVERLLLDVGAADLVTMLRNDRELTVFARPSFSLHFARLWRVKRDAFWTKMLALFAAKDVTPLGRIAPATVVVECAQSVSDFAPLLALLDDAQLEPVARAALKAVIDLVGVGASRVGPTAGPWTALAKALACR